MPNEIQYDVLDFNVRPPYDTWTDLATVHLLPGVWLVGGEALMEARDDTQTWAALFVAESATLPEKWQQVMYCHCDSSGESSGYRTVYLQDVFEIEEETDVILRFRSRGTFLAVPQFVTVAAWNDERTIDAPPTGVWWGSGPGGTGPHVALTHLTAVPIDGLDYVRAVVEVDTLLATKQYNYAVMAIDVDPGNWLILANFAMTGLGNQAAGLVDHAAGMIAVENEVFRYVDDGERGGGHGYNPIFNLHGIKDTGEEGAHIEALAAVLTADADSIYVPASWDILDHFGNPVTTDPVPEEYNTGSLIALRVPRGDDAVSSLISCDTNDCNITASPNQWVEGPHVNIGEGTWVIWGLAHLFINAPNSGFSWACEILVDGVEYALAAREGWGDPAGEALVANSVMAIVEVPEGGFATAKLRAWATGTPLFPGQPGTPGTPGGPGILYGTLIYTIICPEILWVMGPGSPGTPGTPGTPGQPGNRAHASCITAVKLPIDLTSFSPLKQVVKLPTTYPVPTVELYRLPV